MVTFLSKENKISNKLQEDIVRISGENIFINPFLYWRQFDDNTDRWLREPGQIPEIEIELNRSRFYPESDWSILSENEKRIKEGTVEMFLKTLELISTFNPSLNELQMLQVESKMVISKKNSFEKWVKKAFDKKAKIALNEKRKFHRDRFLRTWYEWFSLDTTHKAIFPIIIMFFLAALIGWFAGISKNSCNPYFESSIMNKF